MKALNGTRMLTGDAHDVLTKLEERLAMLLKPVAPEATSGPSGNASPAPPNCQLVERVSDVNATIAGLASRLKTIIDRLEV